MILTLASTPGCLPPKGDCADPFTKTIEPLRIKDGRDVYFSIDDFEFLEKKGLVLDEILLEGTAEHHKHHHHHGGDGHGDGHGGNHFGEHDNDDDDFGLSCNGVKAVRRDGGKHIKFDKDDGVSTFSVELHRLYLNGSVSLAKFLEQIRHNRGVVKISAQSVDGKILTAHLVVRGKIHKKCDQPPPPPPPPPVAPNTTIESVNPTANPTSSTSEAFSFSADQTGVTFKCAIDGAAAELCASPKAYSGLSAGTHRFSVFAVGSTGLADATPAVYNWVVDNVPPDVRITNESALPALTAATSISVEFASTDSASTFVCAIDGAPEASCRSPYLGASLTEGAHKFEVWAIDSLGNRTPSPAVHQWVIDLSTPVARILSVLPESPVNSSAEMTFQFVSNESANFECSVDSGSYFACTSPYVASGVQEGHHWFAVRAVDLAGNVGLAASYSWTTDLTSPVIALGNVVPAPGLTNAHHVTVEFSTSEAADLSCAWDGAPAAPCVSPFIHDVEQQGAHQLVIVASDIAGNTSAPQIVNWTMDFSVPQISFGPITPSANENINATSIALEINSTKTVSLFASVNGGPEQAFTSPLVIDALDEIQYVIVISAVDSLGNRSNEIQHAFSVDRSAPTIEAQATSIGLTNLDSNTVTFVTSEMAQIFCNVDEAGFALCASPVLLSGLAEGSHAVQLYAVDRAGNQSSVIDLNWVVDTLAPHTTISVTQTARDAFRFTLTSTETSEMVCSFDGEIDVPCEGSVEKSGLAGGEHTLRVRATDAAGNAENPPAVVTVAVLEAIHTTIDATMPSSALTHERSMTIDFSSRGAAASYFCALDGEPVVVCVSPVSYTNLPDGAHTFTVFGKDDFGTVEPSGGAAYSWMIDTVAPNTTLSGNQVSRDHVTLNFSANETATFECSIDAGPMTACTSPMELTGISVGAHTFFVHAVDLAQNVDLVGGTFTFTVDPQISTVITSTTPATSPTNLPNMSIHFEANLPTATFVCSLNGAALAPCVSPMNYFEMMDGSYTFRVFARDRFGALDPVGASHVWTKDTVAPSASGVVAAPTSTTITVTWTTNEPSTTILRWGIGFDTNNVVDQGSELSTSHTVRLTGLTPNTLYSLQVGGADAAGNAFIGGRITARTAR